MASSLPATGVRLPHPIVWLILYLPFGALGGFVTVALAFLATQHGLSITDGALIVGSQMLIQWLKWIWAPVVDITLTPKKWYLLSTAFSALGVFLMAAIPLGPENFRLLLAIVALANLINSVVGMSVESMIASLTTEDQIGKVSAWFQAGNLGGTGLGGALGLYLLQHLAKPWMTGAVMGALLLACCLALIPLPALRPHVREKTAGKAVATVLRELWVMLRTPNGFLTGFLCLLPVATGAAQGTLTQAAVAAHWGAGADQVELVQGLLSGLVTAVGCFCGGWICDRLAPRIAYSIFGILLAGIAAGMAWAQPTVSAYVIGNMVYSFAVGLSYAAFTAMVLQAIRQSAAATGYNVFASLSNFPLWWLGLLLGWVAEKHGPSSMLLAEAVLGIVGVVIFLLVEWIKKSAGQRAAA